MRLINRRSAIALDPRRPERRCAPGRAEAPVWFLLWALACAFFLRRSAARELRRSFVALAVVLGGFLALILVHVIYDMLPRQLQTIQLPYRLNAFVAMATAGLVLVAVLAVERLAGSDRKLLANRLQIVSVSRRPISLGLCVWQLWVPSTHSKGSYDNRDLALGSANQTPGSWYEGAGTYADLDSLVVQRASTRMLQIDTLRIHSDHLTLTTTPAPGFGAVCHEHRRRPIRSRGSWPRSSGSHDRRPRGRATTRWCHGAGPGDARAKRRSHDPIADQPGRAGYARSDPRCGLALESARAASGRRNRLASAACHASRKGSGGSGHERRTPIPP
jgi:hypothetical protein